MAKEDIPPQKAFLFIPQKLIINDIVCARDPICGPVYEKHPEIFKDHLDNEYLRMITFVMHHMLIGEKSFWHPFWQIINEADLPMRWSDEEIAELQDNFLQREIITYRDEYVKEFELVFGCFRENKYNEVWPGIIDDTKTEDEIKAEFEPLFYKCFNYIVTRCFGWGLPKTSLIPFADCINHHNVDSTYEFICQELHEPMKNLEDTDDLYNININDFVEKNMELLELDDSTKEPEDASYYTKSKMMFDISEFYNDADEDGEESKSTSPPDVRSAKLTNRSIYTIKKMLVREKAYAVTPDQLQQS